MGGADAVSSTKHHLVKERKGFWSPRVDHHTKSIPLVPIVCYAVLTSSCGVKPFDAKRDFRVGASALSLGSTSSIFGSDTMASLLKAYFISAA